MAAPETDSAVIARPNRNLVQAEIASIGRQQHLVRTGVDIDRVRTGADQHRFEIAVDLKHRIVGGQGYRLHAKARIGCERGID